MPPPTPTRNRTVHQPPPPALLRLVGVVALVTVAVLDTSDGTFSGPGWAYIVGIVVTLWGPPLLAAAPDVIRAVLKRS